MLYALQGFQDIIVGRTNIGIKRMGVIDFKAFTNAYKQRSLEEDADVSAAELCSLWENEIKNSDWHPFRVVMVDGKEMVGIPLLLLLHTCCGLVCYLEYSILWRNPSFTAILHSHILAQCLHVATGLN